MYAAVYIGEKTLYMIVFAMLIAPFFSVLMLFLSFFRLKYYEAVSTEEAVRGEKVDYTLTIKNRDLIIYPFVKVNFLNNNEMKWSNEEEIYISPLHKQTIQKVIQCRHIGKYTVGVESIELWDFFRFVKLRLKLKKENITIQINPRIVKLHGFNAAAGYESDFGSNSISIKVEDYAEISEINKYHSGMPKKNIHWKLSAKRNELMAKKYEKTEGKVIYFFVDMEPYFMLAVGSGAKDIIIETVLAIAKYLLDNHIQAVFCFNDKSLKTLKMNGFYDFNTLYVSLTDMQMEHGFKITDVIKITRMKHFDMNNVIVLTSNITEELTEALTSAAKMRAKAVLICYDNDTVHQQQNAMLVDDLKEKGVPVYYIRHADEIKNVLEK